MQMLFYAKYFVIQRFSADCLAQTLKGSKSFYYQKGLLSQNLGGDFIYNHLLTSGFFCVVCAFITNAIFIGEFDA
jgi:hypothetical protein